MTQLKRALLFIGLASVVLLVAKPDGAKAMGPLPDVELEVVSIGGEKREVLISSRDELAIVSIVRTTRDSYGRIVHFRSEALNPDRSFSSRNPRMSPRGKIRFEQRTGMSLMNGYYVQTIELRALNVMGRFVRRLTRIYFYSLSGSAIEISLQDYHAATSVEFSGQDENGNRVTYISASDGGPISSERKALARAVEERHKQ